MAWERGMGTLPVRPTGVSPARRKGGTPSPREGQDALATGFTLLELVLAMSLLVLLGGLLSISYVRWNQTAQFDESVSHFEAILRLARAEAAGSGKRLRLEFIADGAFKITYEPSPLTEPGAFQDYTAPQWARDLPSEGMKVSACRLTAPTIATVLATPAGGEGALLPPVLFQPDGSSDSATMEIVSRNPEDARTVILDLDGINSTLTRRVLLPSEMEEYRQATAAAE